MTDKIENGATPIELEEVTDAVEQLDFEETDAKGASAKGNLAGADDTDDAMEIVDIDVVKPSEVDLKLEDEPFEIGMETVRKMKEDEQTAASEDTTAGQVEQASDKTSQTARKDIMLTDFDDIMDSLRQSVSKKLILATAFISLIGSFFIFCNIHVGDIPPMPIGNFFNGYSGNILSNIISKISIIAIILSAVFATINLRKFSIYSILIAVLTFIGQCVFFVLWGSMDYAVPLTVFRPGLGFFITLIPLLVMLFAVIGSKPKAKS